jgi:hypothetical protein
MFDSQREEVSWDGEGSVMISFMTCTVAKYCSDDQIKKNDMGRECIDYGGKENLIQGLDVEV